MKKTAWIVTIWGAVYFVVDFFGNVQFVMQQYQDPTWIGLVIKFLIDPPWLFQLGIFVIGCLWLVYVWYGSRKTLSAQRSSTLPTMRTLMTRKSSPSFWDEVQNAGQVWAFWYNGSDAFNRKIFRDHKRPQKLVLLDNGDSALLDYHVRLHGGQKDSLYTAIRDTTKAAEDAGLKVAHWPKPMPFTMTFFEPESHDGRVQVEFQIPDAPLVESPSIVIRRSEQPDIYANLLRFFRSAMGENGA